jgi:ubiquinone/menaquinone biosynthesis C-methylase UbiE
MPDPHRIDPLARAFDGVADVYDQARPDFPPEPIDWAWQRLGLGDDHTVVDLAAGTGKLSQALVARAGRLIAVEPQAEMRRVLAERVPATEIVDATAEDLPFAAGSVRAVFVASAFHWFDGPAALASIHRVLVPGGGLTLLWNDFDDEGQPWGEELGKRLDAVPAPDARPANRPYTGLWRTAFDDTTLFGPLESRLFTRKARVEVDRMLLLMSTWSVVAARPQDEQQALMSDLRGILEPHAVAGEVEVTRRVDVHLTRAL